MGDCHHELPSGFTEQTDRLHDPGHRLIRPAFEGRDRCSSVGPGRIGRVAGRRLDAQPLLGFACRVEVTRLERRDGEAPDALLGTHAERVDDGPECRDGLAVATVQ